jgi:hypothetical protein
MISARRRRVENKISPVIDILTLFIRLLINRLLFILKKIINGRIRLAL